MVLAPDPGTIENVTPLMIACQDNNLQKVTDLLTIKKKFRTSPALSNITAVSKKLNGTFRDQFQALLKQAGRVNPESSDSTGKVALHYCAEMADLSLIQKVYEADPSLLDHKDMDGYTPANFAIIGSKPDSLKFFLERGADVNNTDNEKHSLVHWATVCSQREILELLLSSMALPSTPDLLGAHALHYATQLCVSEQAAAGKEILRLLLKHGANVNCADNDERTPLLWAASSGSADAVQMLVEAGADKKYVDRDFLTALHCAASRGHSHIIKYLLYRGSNLKADPRDKNGCTPLFYAVTLGHVACAKLLLEKQVQPNAQDRKLRTAAHYGAAKGQLNALKLLYQFGASFEMQNHRGDLPIHEAVQSGCKEVVAWLLEIMSQSSVNASNFDGRTALHIAAAAGYADLCAFLLNKGADVNALMQSKNDLVTPLDVATQKDNESVMEFLRNNGGKLASEIPANVLEEVASNFKNQQRRQQEMVTSSSTENKAKEDRDHAKREQIRSTKAGGSPSGSRSLSPTLTDGGSSVGGGRRRNSSTNTDGKWRKSSRKKQKRKRGGKIDKKSSSSRINEEEDDNTLEQHSDSVPLLPKGQSSDSGATDRSGNQSSTLRDQQQLLQQRSKKSSSPTKPGESYHQHHVSVNDTRDDDATGRNGVEQIDGVVRNLKLEGVKMTAPQRNDGSEYDSPTADYASSRSGRSMGGTHYSVRGNIRRYMEEKRIFQELANLKRMQIQYGPVQEENLVRKMTAEFAQGAHIRQGSFQFMTFDAWEKFLYDQLKYMYLQEQEELSGGELKPPRPTNFRRFPARNDKKIDQLTRIYGVAPLPLQYSREPGSAHYKPHEPRQVRVVSQIHGATTQMNNQRPTLYGKPSPRAKLPLLKR